MGVSIRLVLREWMPVRSVNVESNFFQYKHLLYDKSKVIAENTKQILMFYNNGYIEGQD